MCCLRQKAQLSRIDSRFVRCLDLSRFGDCWIHAHPPESITSHWVNQTAMWQTRTFLSICHASIGKDDLTISQQVNHGHISWDILYQHPEWYWSSRDNQKIVWFVTQTINRINHNGGKNMRIIFYCHIALRCLIRMKLQHKALQIFMFDILSI